MPTIRPAFSLPRSKTPALYPRGHPSRRDVLAAVHNIRFKGIAYREPVRWDEKGDNLAAVTALNGVENGRFRQIAEIQQMQSVEQT